MAITSTLAVTGVQTNSDDIIIAADNKKIIFGAGSDASILYNGTDLLISPDDVGSGEVNIGGNLEAVTLSTGGNETFTYDRGTFTATLTGVSGSVTVGSIFALCGAFAIVRIPTMSGTSNASTMTITGLPSQVQPLSTQEMLVGTVLDNNAEEQTTNVKIQTSTITLEKWTGSVYSSTGWTASGTTGWDSAIILVYDLL